MVRHASLSDVGLAARMAAWSLALPVLKHLLPLPSVARLAWTSPRRRTSPIERKKILRIAILLSRFRPRKSRHNCLDRSLLAYRFLAAAGADPRLVIAMGKGDDRVLGHAWVTVDGAPVTSSSDSLREYVPVVAFGRRGERINEPMGAAASAS